MLHVSDLLKYNQCHLLYAYSRNNKDEYPTFLNYSESFGSLINKKLKLNNFFEGSKGDSNEIAFLAMKENEWLRNARFEFKTLRVNIPVIHVLENGIDVYFAKGILYPHEDEILKLVYNIWVLKKLGLRINNIYYLHFNYDYIRQDYLDYDNLLICDSYLYNSKNNISLLINQAIKNNMVDLEDLIDEINNFDINSLNQPVRSNSCTHRSKCIYYNNCFSDENNYPDNSIIRLFQSEHKYLMLNNGIKYLRDADLSLIEGNKQQYAQIMADRNGGLYCDKTILKEFINDSISYPIAFLDFEWDTYAIPPYSKMRPYDVSLFQYSLHILDDDNSELRHEEFLGFDDCRLDLLKDLLDKLPSSGSIVTFNGIGAEEIRMKELAYYFPEYEDKINSIIKRMVDFSLPFSAGMVYDIKMKGLYSLKQIVEIFEDEKSYQSLVIGKAKNAVLEWRNISNNKEKNKDKINDLLIYCGMDTYNLYLIYKWFLKIIGE